VQEIYPALFHDHICIAGGFSSETRGPTERVIALNPANNQWTDAPRLPTPSHHVQLAAVGAHLYAIGGFIGGASRTQWINTTRVLRLENDQWVEGPALPKPIAEGIPLVHGDTIHLIGGRSPRGTANSEWDDQIDVDDHFVLRAGASQWERAAPLPMARNSHAGAVLGDALHVISGRTVAGGQTPAHHIYDLGSGVWREGAAFPEARGGIAAAVWRGQLVAGGGEIFRPPSVGDALYEYDSARGWTHFTTLPTARHGHGLVTRGDALFAVGGSSIASAGQTLASVDILSA
jgi:N-acetylneuraminic acid mutarotase